VNRSVFPEPISPLSREPVMLQGEDYRGFFLNAKNLFKKENSVLKSKKHQYVLVMNR
jgi:hypothetical protein